ncbi:MAG: CBS domain-containing protein [Planctomycetia bacterium]|jgi:CBS domain containing-hemolysin-like protein|nr:CBS domain-containing protein [Planctomycetia bacterium]
MSGLLILILVGCAIIAAWSSALRLSLQDPSRSELEQRLRRRNAGPEESEETSRVEWIFTRRSRLVTEFAFLRIICSVAVTVSYLVIFADRGAEASLDAGDLVLAGVVSAFTLWLLTGVVAGSLATHLGTSLLVRTLPMLRLVDLVLGPLAGISGVIDEAVRRLSGANLQEAEASDRLRRSIEDTTLGGDLDEVAAEMLENVVDFTNTEVGTVMTPRTEIEGIQSTDDLAAIRSIIIEAGHSRIPVYGDNLDEIRGILYVKDLVPYLGTEVEDFRLDRLLRQPIRVPETKPVQDLLGDFQRSEVHMAIVVDEYGGTSGLVTIEDVLEEIVGEIQDEHDTEEELPPAIARVGDDRWEMDARFQIYDLNEMLETALPEDDDFDTVAGFILERLGRVPEAGESVEDLGLRFEVLEAEPTRIERVAVIRLQPSDDEDGLEA